MADSELREHLIDEGSYAALITHSQADPDDPYIWRNVTAAVLDAFLEALVQRGAIGLVSGLKKDAVGGDS